MVCVYCATEKAFVVLSWPESAGETSVLANERVFRGRAMYRRRVVSIVQLTMASFVLSRPESAGETSALSNERRSG